MRLLLDTCTLLWWFAGDDRIPPRVHERLSDPASEVLWSDVSALEIVIKQQLGKLTLAAPASRLLPVLAEKHGFELLSLSSAHIFGLEKLPPVHHDPFDRLLIAQALAEKLVLVTPDRAIARYNVPLVWG